MTATNSLADLLQQDALEDALGLARARVKERPSDRDARNIYIDLLILSGELEKADAQCHLASTLTPEDAVGFALIRRHLRGMVARAAWFSDSAVPSFPGGPSPLDQLALQTGIALKDGAGDEARKHLDELEALRGERPMVWNGSLAGDLRDLDDRIPHALEVLSSGGAYLWVDFAKISSLTLDPITRPRDLAYRSGELTLEDGSAAPVLLPALYPVPVGADAQLQLGRETRFEEAPGGLMTGLGQRCMLVGEAALSFHELASLTAPETDAAIRSQSAHG